MSPEHCESQIARLGVLRGVPGDISEYFTALSDIPELVFVEAVTHALKTRAWFPTPAELRADCDAAQAAFRAPVALEPHVEELVGGGRTVTIANPFGGRGLTIHVTRLWKFDCEECVDTGWRERQCPSEHCGRRQDHAAHTWVEPCQCRDWNPTLKRRREAAGVTYAQRASKVA